MEPKSVFNLNSRWVLWAAVAVATIVAGVAIARVAGFGRSEVEEEVIAPLPEVEAVTALGRVEPENEIINLSAPASLEGTRVAQLLVEEGDRVLQGDIIAVLDSRDIREAALEEARQEIDVQQAELERVEAGAQQGEIAAQRAAIERLRAERAGERDAQTATVERLRAEREGELASQDAAIARLEAQLEGDIAALDATVERVQAELANARLECQRYEQLYRDGAVSASERDRICLQEATARERLSEARANRRREERTLREQLSEARATRTQTARTLQAQIDEAIATRAQTLSSLEAQIAEARATLDRIAEVRPVDVRAARAAVDRATAAAGRAREELDLSYIRSPVDGRILDVRTRAGEVTSEDGIVEIGVIDQMNVIAEIYETDIEQVRLGQRAIVTSDAFAEELQGTVEQIGLKIGRQDVLDTDPAADADVRVVEVEIRLDPEDSERVSDLTNLQVEVKILL